MKETLDQNLETTLKTIMDTVERLSRGPEVYMTINAVCQKLDVSRRTFERWRKEGRMPEEVRVNDAPRYRDSDIEKMIANQNPHLVGMKQNKVMADAAAVVANL